MNSISTLLTNRRFLAIAFVVIGLITIAFFSIRSYRAYQQWQYIEAQGLDQGGANVGAIRPWMTMRYVSVAYAVPQEYIFAELDIPYNRRNSNDTLGHLTRVYEEEKKSDKNNLPILVVKVGEIIQTYLKNPVATGLNDIRPWMTLQYIANSEGVPVSYFFQKLDIPFDNYNEFKQLDKLAHDVKFPKGSEHLQDRIKDCLRSYEAAK